MAPEKYANRYYLFHCIAIVTLIVLFPHLTGRSLRTEHWLKVEPGSSCLVGQAWPSNKDFGSVVKNLPAMQKTWAQSLGWEDTLEKEMATHSSMPAWKTQWTEKPGGLQSMGVTKEWDTT